MPDREYEVVATEWRDGLFLAHIRHVETGDVYQQEYAPDAAAELAQGVLDAMNGGSE